MIAPNNIEKTIIIMLSVFNASIIPRVKDDKPTASKAIFFIFSGNFSPIKIPMKLPTITVTILTKVPFIYKGWRVKHSPALLPYFFQLFLSFHIH